MRFLLALPVLAVVANAVEFIFPKEHTKVKPGEKIVVKWDFVETDPKTISLYLVNFVDFPPSYVPLAIDVDTEDGKRKVKIPFDTEPSWGYQINAIKDNNLFVIEAQTSHFAVIERERHERHDRHDRHRKEFDSDSESDSDSDSDSDDEDGHKDGHRRHRNRRHRRNRKHGGHDY